MTEPAAAAGLWFHGGVFGLDVGDLLLPPTETHVRCMAELIADAVADRVYITPAHREAIVYAGIVSGAVYEVEPIGAVDMEHALSYTCERARIVRVVNPHVSPATAMAVMRRIVAEEHNG